MPKPVTPPCESIRGTLLAWVFAAAPAAQATPELPPLDGWIQVEATRVRVDALRQRPPQASADDAKWSPVLLLLLPVAMDGTAVERRIAEIGADAARAGFEVVVPLTGGGNTMLPNGAAAAVALPAQAMRTTLALVRSELHVAQGALHVLVDGDLASWQPALLQHREQFQTFTVLEEVDDEATLASTAPLRALPARRVHVLPGDDAEARRSWLAALRAERAVPAGAAAEVARTLDDFHDAAAKGDEARYFAILPDDAVFFGTDPGERWTGAEFRAFAMPYFLREEAWSYFALQRHVAVAPGGEVAWFDEVLANSAYGECRGTGVLVRRDERWVLQQYDLTIPVPNDLAGDLVARIRAMQGGAAQRRR